MLKSNSPNTIALVVIGSVALGLMLIIGIINCIMVICSCICNSIHWLDFDKFDSIKVI